MSQKCTYTGRDQADQAEPEKTFKCAFYIADRMFPHMMVSQEAFLNKKNIVPFGEFWYWLKESFI